MKKIHFYRLLNLLLLTAVSHTASAGDTVKAYELLYDEQEQGTDVYRNRYLVTDNYIRIDDTNDASGYILFDNSKATIYSISHDDRSILVIQNAGYQRPDMHDSISLEYRPLPGAPGIAGKPVYNYRVVAAAPGADICMDLQLVAGLLPDVTTMLAAYQKVVASQQAKVLQNTPEEFRTSCFLYDQVYNDGRYYEKGLPIQEWHSNRKKKLLVSYKTIDAAVNLFAVPDDYRQYSID